LEEQHESCKNRIYLQPLAEGVISVDITTEMTPSASGWRYILFLQLSCCSSKAFSRRRSLLTAASADFKFLFNCSILGKCADKRLDVWTHWFFCDERWAEAKPSPNNNNNYLFISVHNVKKLQHLFFGVRLFSRLWQQVSNSQERLNSKLKKQKKNNKYKKIVDDNLH